MTSIVNQLKGTEMEVKVSHWISGCDSALIASSYFSHAFILGTGEQPRTIFLADIPSLCISFAIYLAWTDTPHIHSCFPSCLSVTLVQIQLRDGLLTKLPTYQPLPSFFLQNPLVITWIRIRGHTIYFTLITNCNFPEYCDLKYLQDSTDHIHMRFP